jgi:pyruvate dehydrogenase E2 component (dihydrolipoamide acetyltransferase)
MPQVAIVMPKMSMTMTEGELLIWHVSVGQVINAGDVVCEVATDKVDMEVEATASGKIISLLGNPGDVIEVGAPLVMVDSEEDDLLAGIFDTPKGEPQVIEDIQPKAVAAPHSQPTVEQSTQSVQATPKARAAARENDLSLIDITPSRSSGVITHEDVLSHDSSDSQLPTRDFAARLKTRIAIARALQSSTTIPTFSMTFETPAVAMATHEINRLVVVASAWAAALKQHPELHVKWQDANSHTFDEVVIAISVMTPKGVVTPALKISNTTNVQDLTTILENAKQSKIALEHLGSSTTGLADLADFELKSMSGILVAPQSTALTICAIKPVLRFSITADHRVADPADISLLAKSFIRNLR